MNFEELFAEPGWLAAGALLLLGAAALLRWSQRRRERDLAQLAGAFATGPQAAAPRLALRRIKTLLWLCALAACCVALARPRGGAQWREFSSQGIDFILAFDVSKSMLTQDVRPSRLERVRLAAMDLLGRLGGDRVGVIAFAGEAFLQCPPTSDYDAVGQSIGLLSPDLITRGGTDIASAIGEARNVFGKQSAAQKILVLVTDGEDLGGQAQPAAAAAAKEGIRIFTVGVGTPAGELIPIPKEGGGVDFVRDERGQFVKSRLDESALRAIAAAAQGVYYPLGALGDGLERLYREQLQTLPKREGAARRKKTYREFFQIPLALAVLAWMAEWLLVERPGGVGPSPRFSGKNGTRAAAVLLLLAMSGTCAMAGDASDAWQAYRRRDFPTAEAAYARAATVAQDPAQLQFNAGAAAYKAGDWQKAQEHFTQALKTDSPQLQEKVYYNLGNTSYRTGQAELDKNREATIAAWQRALQYYKAALALEGKDADARYNYDLVKRKLEELLKQKQKEQEQQQKRDQQKNQQPQNQQGQQQQSQPQNGQQKAGQQNSQQQPQPSPGNSGGASQSPPSPSQQSTSSGGQSGGGQQKSSPPPGQPPNASGPSPAPAQSSSGASAAHQGPGGTQPPPAPAAPANQSQRPIERGANIEPARPGGAQQQQAAAPRAGASEPAGGMTPEEAARFLDSQKPEEVLLVPGARGKGREEPPVARDW